MKSKRAGPIAGTSSWDGCPRSDDDNPLHKEPTMKDKYDNMVLEGDTVAVKFGDQGTSDRWFFATVFSVYPRVIEVQVGPDYFEWLRNLKYDEQFIADAANEPLPITLPDDIVVLDHAPLKG